MKPPLYYRSAQSRELLKPRSLAVVSMVMLSSSHPQSIPALHTLKNSYLIYLNSLCRIQALKGMWNHSVVQQLFQEQSCKQLLNVDSKAGRKTFATPSRSLTLPLAASRFLSWLNRLIVKENPFSLGTTSHRRLALMDVTHDTFSHMGLSGRKKCKNLENPRKALLFL